MIQLFVRKTDWNPALEIQLSLLPRLTHLVNKLHCPRRNQNKCHLLLAVKRVPWILKISNVYWQASCFIGTGWKPRQWVPAHPTSPWSADHSTSFPLWVRLQEAEDHFRETECITELFFPLVLDSSRPCRQNGNDSLPLERNKKAFCHSYVLIERW